MTTGYEFLFKIVRKQTFVKISIINNLKLSIPNRRVNINMSQSERVELLMVLKKILLSPAMLVYVYLSANGHL